MIVEPLTAPRRDAYLSFFDEAFRDNPEWGSCYCMGYMRTESEWSGATAESNRSDVAKFIDADAAPGLLAYEGDQVIGWCRALPLLEVTAFAGTPMIGDDAADVGSIVCFVVDPDHRGKGVATRLLNDACDRFRQAGFKFAEAYPRKKQASAAEAYEGPIAMYEHHGFEVVEERPNRLRMRLAL